MGLFCPVRLGNCGEEGTRDQVADYVMEDVDTSITFTLLGVFGNGVTTVTGLRDSGKEASLELLQCHQAG